MDISLRNLNEYQRLLGIFSVLTIIEIKIDHVANVVDLKQIENLLFGQILENWLLQNSNRNNPRTMVLVWDT